MTRPAPLAAACLALLVAGAAGAAELRGRIWSASDTARAPANATVKVTCGGISKNAGLSGNGSFSIRGLPSNASCELVVSVAEAASRPVSLRTNATVARFNAELRRVGGNVIVLPR